VEATYTEWYDGLRAAGRSKDELYLEKYPVSEVTLVQEDGVTLTTGTGYDSAGTIQVLVEAARGVLRRRPGGADMSLAGMSAWRRWSGRYQNIKVVYKAGWASGSVPADLTQVCIELALMLYKQSSRSGSGSMSMSGASVEAIEELSERGQRVIRRYEPKLRPRMRAA
jgi:hypothetical protein